MITAGIGITDGIGGGIELAVSAAPRKGFELKVEIHRQGLKIETVAQRCGVSRQHLGRVLNGHVDMYDKLARDLAFALRIPKERIYSLWRGEE